MSRMRNKKVRFIGVALDGSSVSVRRYMTDHDFDISYVIKLSDESRTALGVSMTPTTLVIEADGTLAARWKGPLYNHRGEVSDLFGGMLLPELLDQAAEGFGASF